MADDAAATGTRFPAPPLSFSDKRDREIDVRAVEEETEDEAPLVEMYAAYTDADRAQGIPPRRDEAVADWVRGLLSDGLNLVAFHGDRAVGHAALLPYEDDAELIIFVHPDYHHAGIGSRLIRALLGHGERAGITDVWLSVERDNHVAMNLYRSVGFQTRKRDRTEHEMELSLGEDRPASA